MHFKCVKALFFGFAYLRKLQLYFVIINIKQKDELGVSIKEVDRRQLWLMARKNNSGGYETDVQQVAKKIASITFLLLTWFAMVWFYFFIFNSRPCMLLRLYFVFMLLQENSKSLVEQGSSDCHRVSDILTTILEKQLNDSRVQGIGQLITPIMYFHVPTASNLDMERMVIEKKVFEERYRLTMTWLYMMATKLNVYSRIKVGSCSVVNTKSPISRHTNLKAQLKLKTKVIIFVIFLFNI